MAKATNHTKTASAAAAEPGEEPQPASARVTKLGRIRAMLAVPGGATLPALCDATDWQAHSVRAALTGLRKAGASVEKGKGEDGITVYRIDAAAGTGESEGKGGKSRAGAEALS